MLRHLGVHPSSLIAHRVKSNLEHVYIVGLPACLAVGWTREFEICSLM